jgi:phospholipase C
MPRQEKAMSIFSKIFDWFKSFASGPANTGPIKHVVVLMFENHSFDQMLGCFRAIFPNEVDGVDAANPWSNKDSTGKLYFQRLFSDSVISPDPKHELDHILNQIKDGNSGFVSDYEKEYVGQNPDLQRIMDYFGPDDLPALHALARNFTICDRWYSSVPGPTWTNRFFGFFAPASGVDEDPMTGSAHCCLGDFWSKRLGKKEFVAFQASARGGVVRVRVTKNRAFLGGKVVTVARGELLVEGDVP